MFYIRSKDEVVGKSIDKRNYIKLSVDLYKYITKKIFDGEITRWNQILEIQKKIFDAFEFDERYCKPYSINKDISEYKNKQDWMQGIENFKAIMPEYKGYIEQGYLLHLFGRGLYGKSGRKLKWPEEVILAIPNDMMDRVDMLLHKFQIHYGSKVRMNWKHYEKALFGRIKIFKKILEG
jgi:hypothetical protein